MQDAAGQADLFRELLIDVDRVRVAGSLGVALGESGVGGDVELGQGVAGGEIRHQETPLTMLVQVAFTTWAPS